jgi:uncharacterized membrane protein
MNEVSDLKTNNNRTVMHVLYGMHTVAWWFTGGLLAVIATIVHYVMRGDETDAIYLAHHNYMIATFWWTLLWLMVTWPLFLLLFFPGATAWFVVSCWYLYRCIKGWLRFNNDRVPQ